MYQVVKGSLLDEVTRRVQLDICYDTTAKKECKLLVESKEKTVGLDVAFSVVGFLLVVCPLNV